jgi:Holliday junction resolvase RusA-like endonuclease
MDDLDLAFDDSAMQFFVPGIPAPGGSKRAFAIKKGGVYTGRTVVFDDAGKRNKDWRAVVAHAGRDAMAGREPLRGALSVVMHFALPRPKKHYHTGKRAAELRDDAPHWHTGKPDALKLARSTEDALTGIAWADDAQTAVLTCSKYYSTNPGCHIRISIL